MRSTTRRIRAGRHDAATRALTRIMAISVAVAALLVSMGAMAAGSASADSDYTAQLSGPLTIGPVSGPLTAGAQPPGGSHSWTAPSGTAFYGFFYDGNYEWSDTDENQGGLAIGFVGTGLTSAPTGGSASDSLLFPYDEDCTIVHVNHVWDGDWADGAQAGSNSASCIGGGDAADYTGDASLVPGGTYDNVEHDSQTGNEVAGVEFATLSYQAWCQATSCSDDDSAYGQLSDLFADIDDPNSTPAASASSTINRDDWYQTDSSSPSWTIGASDPAGVCYLGIDLGGPQGIWSGNLVSSPAMISESMSPLGGDAFSSESPCGNSSASATWSPPAGINSGTYNMAVVASNPGNWQAGDTNGATAPTVATYDSELNVDDQVPTATWESSAGGWSSNATENLDVTAGPSGVASVTCTDNGTRVTPTLVSGSTSGAGTTVWSVPMSDTAGANSVSCTAADGDVNGPLTGSSGSQTFDVDTVVPQISFSDGGYTAGAWTNQSQAVAVAATGGPSGLQGVWCAVDGGEATQLTDAEGGTVTVSADGQHTLSCYADSNTGMSDQSSPATFEVNIDDRQPSESFLIDGAAPSSAEHSDTPIVQVNGTETGGVLSGLSKIDCTITTNGRPDPDSPVVLTPGNGLVNNSGSFELDQNGADLVSCVGTTVAGTVESAADTTTVNVDDTSLVAGGGDLTKYGSSPLIDNGGNPFSNGPSQSHWYVTPQTVTITANNTGGDASIASISCQGAVNNTWPISNLNTDAAGGEQITVTVAPPGGNLGCTATDTAGNTYPLGNYLFQLDDQAPTGHFDAIDPSNPDRIALSVTDNQGSGVADVVVVGVDDATGSSNSWPAAYDSSSGQWVAQVNDGSVPPGTYTFHANVVDVAGNQGQLVAGPSGQNEVLNLPLRDMTALSADLSAGSQTAAGAEQATAPAAAQAARAARAGHSAQTLSTHRQRIVKALVVGYGDTALLTGTLKNLGDREKPVGNAVIEVEQQVVGQTKISRLATVRTNRAGAYRYRVKSGASRTILVLYGGTTLLRSADNHVAEEVHGAARIHVSGILAPGHTLTLAGQLDGGFVPARGALITVQYAVKGFRGWAIWGDTHTNSRGRFSVNMPVFASDRGHTFSWRVTISGQTGWAYLDGQSNTITREIGQ